MPETHSEIADLERCVQSVLDLLQSGAVLTEEEHILVRQAAGKLLLALDRWEPGRMH